MTSPNVLRCNMNDVITAKYPSLLSLLFLAWILLGRACLPQTWFLIHVHLLSLHTLNVHINTAWRRLGSDQLFLRPYLRSFRRGAEGKTLALIIYCKGEGRSFGRCETKLK